MYDNANSYLSYPPGTFQENLAPPSGRDQAIEKAILIEHRFAFFFWLKWKRKLEEDNNLSQSTPTLITIDWHQDLAAPSEPEKVELKKLNQDKLSDITNFTWARLNQNNDGHILASAYLNLIGDIIVLKHQGFEEKTIYEDRFGNSHNIHEFKDYGKFHDYILERKDQNIFLDIDLDYFIHGEVIDGKPHSYEVYAKSEIQEIIDPGSDLIKYILPKIDGITMAMEPEFCGGILNSCEIMQTVHSQLFQGSNRWRHLSK